MYLKKKLHPTYNHTCTHIKYFMTYLPVHGLPALFLFFLFVPRLPWSPRPHLILSTLCPHAQVKALLRLV